MYTIEDFSKEWGVDKNIFVVVHWIFVLNANEWCTFTNNWIEAAASCSLIADRVRPNISDSFEPDISLHLLSPSLKSRNQIKCSLTKSKCRQIMIFRDSTYMHTFLQLYAAWNGLVWLPWNTSYLSIYGGLTHIRTHSHQWF